MNRVSIIYLLTMVFLSVEVPLRSVRKQRSPRTLWTCQNWILSLVIVAAPALSFFFSREQSGALINWWLPYLQLFLFFLAVHLFSNALHGYLDMIRSTFIIYLLLLFCLLGVFWLAPALQYMAKGPEIASGLLYINPLFFAAKPLAVDVLRLPSLYSRTPLSQMYVRYPDPWEFCFSLTVLSGIFILVLYTIRRRGMKKT